MAEIGGRFIKTSTQNTVPLILLPVGDTAASKAGAYIPGKKADEEKEWTWVHKVVFVTKGVEKA